MSRKPTLRGKKIADAVEMPSKPKVSELTTEQVAAALGLPLWELDGEVEVVYTFFRWPDGRDNPGQVVKRSLKGPVGAIAPELVAKAGLRHQKELNEGLVTETAKAMANSYGGDTVLDGDGTRQPVGILQQSKANNGLKEAELQRLGASARQNLGQEPVGPSVFTEPEAKPDQMGYSNSRPDDWQEKYKGRPG